MTPKIRTKIMFSRTISLFDRKERNLKRLRRGGGEKKRKSVKRTENVQASKQDYKIHTNDNETDKQK